MCVGTQHVAKDSSTKGFFGENCNRRHHRALCSCELTNKNDTSDPCGNRCPRNTLCASVYHESCETGITFSTFCSAKAWSSLAQLQVKWKCRILES